MKTNQVMVSENRDLFGIKIRQQTATNFLNLSDLQDAYDSVRFQKGWSNREINDILRSRVTAERCFYIIENQDLTTKPDFLGFMKDVEEQGLVKVLKSLYLYETRGRWNEKAAWCNPYIWVMIALEMNPEIYGKVIVWLTDTLILNRIAAGVMYRPLTDQIKTKLLDTVPLEKSKYIYADAAVCINHRIFGRHENGIRNFATAEELSKLSNIELVLTNLIKYGTITTFEQFKTIVKSYEF